ncbi:NAD(P)-dependent oxidoreductase [Actinomadura rudentiformis]|uniref:NAD(P)-dependent oxidoreductase n=1 Tax=Actinomadura rudentiformis TaxID=359158 RepID=A0A6H9YR12_9ACTN|nr:NAD(P)-binding domain-containing protein [Actinomadura rudentiformis]KAB2350108.1 NAD(P)-dependent oxidoreductase [Actinomadura rudentiformis]
MRSREESLTPVTVIGLGLMGQALAGAFLRAGHPTTVWNRTAAKADQLVAEGAKLADSVKDAVAASPLVVICVTDHDAVHRLRESIADVLDGKVLVNLTSGTSQEARETAEWAAERGAGCLAGAIMSIPQQIGTAESLILYSGPRSAFELHEASLRNLGEGAMYLSDDHGLASLYAGAGVSLVWSILNGFLYGAALLGTAGVDASTFDPFAQQYIATMSGLLSGYAQQIDEGSYPAPDATIDTHVAAMNLLAHESESLGVNAELPKFFKTLAGRAIAEGHGGDGYAAMIELFRKPSPVKA